MAHLRISKAHLHFARRYSVSEIGIQVPTSIQKNMVKLTTSGFFVEVSRSQTVRYLNVLCGTDFTIAAQDMNSDCSGTKTKWSQFTDIQFDYHPISKRQGQKSKLLLDHPVSWVLLTDILLLQLPSLFLRQPLKVNNNEQSTESNACQYLDQSIGLFLGGQEKTNRLVQPIPKLKKDANSVQPCRPQNTCTFVLTSQTKHGTQLNSRNYTGVMHLLSVFRKLEQ